MAVSEDICRIRIERDMVLADSVIVVPNAAGAPADKTKSMQRLGLPGCLVDARGFKMLFQSVRLFIDDYYGVSLEISSDDAERKSFGKVSGSQVQKIPSTGDYGCWMRGILCGSS